MDATKLIKIMKSDWTFEEKWTRAFKEKQWDRMEAWIREGANPHIKLYTHRPYDEYDEEDHSVNLMRYVLDHWESIDLMSDMKRAMNKDPFDLDTMSSSFKLLKCLHEKNIFPVGDVLFEPRELSGPRKIERWINKPVEQWSPQDWVNICQKLQKLDEVLDQKSIDWESLDVQPMSQGEIITCRMHLNHVQSFMTTVITNNGSFWKALWSSWWNQVQGMPWDDVLATQKVLKTIENQWRSFESDWVRVLYQRPSNVQNLGLVDFSQLRLEHEHHFDQENQWKMDLAWKMSSDYALMNELVWRQQSQDHSDKDVVYQKNLFELGPMNPWRWILIYIENFHECLSHAKKKATSWDHLMACHEAMEQVAIRQFMIIHEASSQVDEGFKKENEKNMPPTQKKEHVGNKSGHKTKGWNNDEKIAWQYIAQAMGWKEMESLLSSLMMDAMQTQKKEQKQGHDKGALTLKMHSQTMNALDVLPPPWFEEGFSWVQMKKQFDPSRSRWAGFEGMHGIILEAMKNVLGDLKSGEIKNSTWLELHQPISFLHQQRIHGHGAKARWVGTQEKEKMEPFEIMMNDGSVLSEEALFQGSYYFLRQGRPSLNPNNQGYPTALRQEEYRSYSMKKHQDQDSVNINQEALEVEIQTEAWLLAQCGVKPHWIQSWLAVKGKSKDENDCQGLSWDWSGEDQDFLKALWCRWASAFSSHECFDIQTWEMFKKTWVFNEMEQWFETHPESMVFFNQSLNQSTFMKGRSKDFMNGSMGMGEKNKEKTVLESIVSHGWESLEMREWMPQMKCFFESLKEHHELQKGLNQVQEKTKKTLRM